MKHERNCNVLGVSYDRCSFELEDVRSCKKLNYDTVIEAFDVINGEKVLD